MYRIVRNGKTTRGMVPAVLHKRVVRLCEKSDDRNGAIGIRRKSHECRFPRWVAEHNNAIRISESGTNTLPRFPHYRRDRAATFSIETFQLRREFFRFMCIPGR
jgi:hypothetical protein